MGKTVTKSDQNVLKLIHPGKKIEIYTKPIQASEVLKNYPKFCITRPDVFKFPWIVVRPDSVLVPGKVFFLVPKRTLYRLLKTNQPPDRSLLLPLSSSFCTSLTISRPSSPLTKSAGMTPKHPIQLPHSSKRTREDKGRRGRKSSHVEPCVQPQSSSRKGRKNSHTESSLSTSSARSVADNVRRGTRYSSSHVHDFNKCGYAGSVDKRKKGSLRSCMRKHGSAPRLANPRVKFSILGEDIVEPVTKQRTVIKSFSRLATSLVVDTCR